MVIKRPKAPPSVQKLFFSTIVGVMIWAALMFLVALMSLAN
jgi:hypothetical protein